MIFRAFRPRKPAVQRTQRAATTQAFESITHSFLKWLRGALSRFLVLADLTQGDGSGPVSVGLLDTASSGGRLASSLGSKLLSGSFSSGGLTCGLLGTSHGKTSLRVLQESKNGQESRCVGAVTISAVERRIRIAGGVTW